MTDHQQVHLSHEEISRYSRHLIMPEVGMEGQRKLKAGSVLLIGTGGLGSPLAMYLAAAGVGRIGLVDYDIVDESNLQRQIIHGTHSLGKLKVESAKERILDINPHIQVDTYNVPLTSDNALELFEPYDVIADGTDNFPTRYLVNDACVILRKPNVYGSIFRFEGQVTVFDMRREDSPNYRDLFPEPPPPGLVPSCAEGGVLGVLPGTIGALQATEAIKLITEVGKPLVGRMMLYDALNMTFTTIKVRKNPDTPPITKLIDYEAFCGVPGHDNSAFASDNLDVVPTLTVEQVKERVDSGDEFILLDVREPHEWEISDISQATHHIPGNQVIEHLGELDTARDIVVYCKTGGRSADVTRLLQQHGYKKVHNMAGGINRWARVADPNLPTY